MDLLLLETARFRARQAAEYRLPGYVIVESVPAIERLDALDDEAAIELTRLLARTERVQRELLAPQRVYMLRFAELVPRLHVHVIPRTAELGRAYAAETGDEPPYRGAALVDWLWRRHASLGHTEDELAAFVADARRLLAAER